MQEPEQTRTVRGRGCQLAALPAPQLLPASAERACLSAAIDGKGLLRVAAVGLAGIGVWRRHACFAARLKRPVRIDCAHAAQRQEQQ